MERGFLNTKLKNVFAICKGLNINPEDLESGFTFVQPNNIVLGDNNGFNGLDGGRHNTNTYNINNKDNAKQDKHNDSMQSIGTADLPLQRSLLNARNETNQMLDRIIELLEQKKKWNPNILLPILSQQKNKGE
ncbi:hypothetical protein [Streptococcus sp. DD12]|uniref:hypothetical protein n=1 Tax=Streptococcus sp. DD12 TaxID=1777880 RepID=UPI0008334CAE|nr:hypothetical protein [Streptococcus sp. DD12]